MYSYVTTEAPLLPHFKPGNRDLKTKTKQNKTLIFTIQGWFNKKFFFLANWFLIRRFLKIILYKDVLLYTTLTPPAPHFIFFFFWGCFQTSYSFSGQLIFEKKFVKDLLYLFYVKVWVSNTKYLINLVETSLFIRIVVPPSISRDLDLNKFKSTQYNVSKQDTAFLAKWF